MGSRKVTPGGEVDWFGEELLLRLSHLTREGIEAIAAQVDGLTKQNIVANDQVDTGFMVNSVYYVTGDDSTYNDDSGMQVDRDGNLVYRDMAPEAALPADYDALVCVGADYAIFQEMQQPFLYPALLQVQTMVGGILQAKAKEVGL